jgi:hypothetical protein
LLNFFLLNSILMREGSRLLTKIIKNVKKSNYSLIYENFTFKRKIVTKYEHWYPFLCSRMRDYQDIHRFKNECGHSLGRASGQPTSEHIPKLEPIFTQEMRFL